MNIKIFTLLLVIFALNTHAQTVAWRGVSDLGGNGLAIVTGSQTVSADGSYSSSSSSSSSSFSGGSGSSSSVPRTTWTVASSRPLTVTSTPAPATQTLSVQSSTQSPSLIGSWFITNVGNQSANIPTSFSSTYLNFNYCNPQSFSYSTTGSSLITITGGAATGTRTCSYTGPTQTQIRSALNGAYSYSFLGNELFVKNSLGNNLLTFNRNSRNVTSLNPVVLDSITSGSSASQGVTGGRTVVQTPASLSNTIISPQSLIGNWKVTAVNGYPIEFDVTIDSTQIGYKYCNTKGFSYSFSGSSLSISSKFSTKMACLNLYPTEASVDGAFSSVSTFALSNNTLRLINKSSQTTVTLVKS